VIQFVFLDSGPLSLLTHPHRTVAPVAIEAWLLRCLLEGRQVIVPAIVYYELRRELLRANKTLGMKRLDDFVNANPSRYLALTDRALRLASELWAQSRRTGRPTASPHALDIDVLIAAQALALGASPSELVIATTNRKHLSQFVDARDWTEILF
jgi:predicted nucleic acid-binding protein